MKGTIVKCLQDLVSSKFGKDKWEKSLESVGIQKNMSFLPTNENFKVKKLGPQQIEVIFS
ncbi:MAG: heme NO-binding domain-containing protein [Desulfobacterales bacterium]|nr:heme NO-binding domain-containing protein [Desulfobacterales bacterium]